MKKRIIVLFLMVLVLSACSVTEKEVRINGTVKWAEELAVTPDSVYGISVGVRINDESIKRLGLSSDSEEVVNHFTELDTRDVANIKPGYHLTLMCRISRTYLMFKFKYESNIYDHSCRYISGSD